MKNVINYTSVFIIFSGALSFQNFLFAEARVSYLIIFGVFLLLLPFLKGLHFNKTFLLLFLSIVAFSLYSVYIGNNTFELFAKQFVGILTSVFFFYLLIKINGYDIKRLFKVYLNIAFLVALIGVSQEISYLVGFKYGWNFKWLLPVWVAAPALGGGLLKVNSILPEPGHFCNVMIPAFFVALSTFFRDDFKFQARWKSAIVIVAFLLTFSGSGYMSALFVVLVIFYRKSRIRHVILSVVAMCALAFLMYNYVAEFRDRIDSSVNVLTGEEKLENAHISSYALLSNALVSYHSFMDSPLIGHGLGSHEVSCNKYRNEGIIPVSRYKMFLNYQDASSLFLRLVSETGLFGILLFFGFIVKFYIGKERAAHEYLWIINSACMCMFFSKLLRMGHYFVDGFFFFFWLYYFSKKLSESERKTANVSY